MQSSYSTLKAAINPYGKRIGLEQLSLMFITDVLCVSRSSEVCSNSKKHNIFKVIFF